MSFREAGRRPIIHHAKGLKSIVFWLMLLPAAPTWAWRLNDAAIFSDGKLWILSEGQLFTVAQGDRTPTEQILPVAVLDMCLQDQHPIILTCSISGCDSWTLRRWSDSQWQVQDTARTMGDDLLRIACSEDTVAVLTSRRLIESSKNKQTSVFLRNELSPAPYLSMLLTPRRLLVAASHGEWGGGLWSIDRYSGSLTEIINDNGRGENVILTDGDLVHRIVPLPWKADCIAATTGFGWFGMSWGGSSRSAEK